MKNGICSGVPPAGGGAGIEGGGVCASAGPPSNSAAPNTKDIVNERMGNLRLERFSR
jgi:hypothetical protein